MAVHESTGAHQLPLCMELVFGTKPEIPGVLGLEYLQKLQNRLHVVHKGAQDRQGAKQKRVYDVRSNNRDFAAGDRVWDYSPKRKKGYSPKLYSHWHGPEEDPEEEILQASMIPHKAYPLASPPATAEEGWPQRMRRQPRSLRDYIWDAALI
ncbi:hypothetical protein QQF64_025576 [Cirrhinus molitorella]|uniref:Uncharacterized protein n=1 Tax=Cirrhinus molitorella TaxID=172907 RepID=A0ABR3NQG9_9TELE